MFIMTKWTTALHEKSRNRTVNKKPPYLNHYFRLLDDNNITYGYGYSDEIDSTEPLEYYSVVYPITQIEYKYNGVFKKRNIELL